MHLSTVHRESVWSSARLTHLCSSEDEEEESHEMVDEKRFEEKECGILRKSYDAENKETEGGVKNHCIYFSYSSEGENKEEVCTQIQEKESARGFKDHVCDNEWENGHEVDERKEEKDDNGNIKREEEEGDSNKKGEDNKNVKDADNFTDETDSSCSSDKKECVVDSKEERSNAGSTVFHEPVSTAEYGTHFQPPSRRAYISTPPLSAPGAIVPTSTSLTETHPLTTPVNMAQVSPFI